MRKNSKANSYSLFLNLLQILFGFFCLFHKKDTTLSLKNCMVVLLEGIKNGDIILVDNSKNKDLSLCFIFFSLSFYVSNYAFYSLVKICHFYNTKITTYLVVLFFGHRSH